MSEQVVDLRSSWAVIRRRSGLLAIAALVGGLVGAGLFYLFPPQYSSVSIVLLPAGSSNAAGESTGYDAETQALIAGSSEVLAMAGQALTPPLTPTQVEDRVKIAAPSPSLLRFTATGETAADAETLATAIARRPCSAAWTPSTSRWPGPRNDSPTRTGPRRRAAPTRQRSPS